MLEIGEYILSIYFDHGVFNCFSASLIWLDRGADGPDPRIEVVDKGEATGWFDLVCREFAVWKSRLVNYQSNGICIMKIWYILHMYMQKQNAQNIVNIIYAL